MTKLAEYQMIGVVAGSTTAVATFCYKTYAHVVRPIREKIMAAIDQEVKFRQDCRETVAAVREMRSFFKQLTEMFEWYQRMRMYADVKLVPKTMAAAAVSSSEKPNGETTH